MLPKSFKTLASQMVPSCTWDRALCFISLATLFLSVAPDTDPDDVAALKAFLNKIEDPFGRLQNWEGNDPCGDNWEGVFCSDAVDNIRSVTELRLLNHNLTGQLAPQLGNLKNLQILDLMWNQIIGSIPPDLGNLSLLRLLLLNGNNLTGQIPRELGYLQMLNRLQIDLNQISGPIPDNFYNLTKVKHLHMNNNSISGLLPAGLGSLTLLVHLLVENNNLMGEIPGDLANASALQILQLDNNRLTTTIPENFGQIATLTKLSLRNCSLYGNIPDLSALINLEYLDLSNNQLEGKIPNVTSQVITTIDLSNNLLNGTIPESFGYFPKLQTLEFRNNNLTGPIPESLGTGNSFVSWNASIFMDFQNNSLSTVSTNLTEVARKNVNVWLNGNREICNGANAEINLLCTPHTASFFSENKVEDDNYGPSCNPVTCSPGEEPIPSVYFKEGLCLCAMPIVVGYRIKSPGFLFFTGYIEGYEQWVAKGIKVSADQVHLDSFLKEPGPRFATILKIFPIPEGNRAFNASEVEEIFKIFSGWLLPPNDTFGPQEFIFFNYSLNGVSLTMDQKKKMNWGAIAAILVGCITATAAIAAAIAFFVLRQGFCSRSPANTKSFLRKGKTSYRPIKVTGVKNFTFEELSIATKSFSESVQVGQGGYGNVYRGVLSDGHFVAIKRAKEGSLQGADEFYTEIELLSRLHHRNLVSLVGYCLEEDEQMLVYEFIANGTLRDHLSSSTMKNPLDFATRFRIALGAGRGILYLHTEANPPIFHRDIKATNILLDEKNNARVADFGLSKLAPNPEIEGSAPGYVSTMVKGTPGYLDPEYFLTHKLTDKSDVYSFGVVLLELITGMHPIAQGKNIVREVKYAYENGLMIHIVDPKMGAYPAEALEPWVRLALACCKDDSDSRPSMNDLVRDLEEIWRSVHWSESLIMCEADAEAEAEAVTGIDSKVKENVSKVSRTKNSYVSSDGDTSELVSQTLARVDPR